MLKIGICDDDPRCIEECRCYITKWAAGRGINTELYHFSRGEHLLEHIRSYGRYDLLFIDIEIQGMNGLETAERIRTQDQFTTFILMSQYDSYFQAGYEVHPFYFFKKPFGEAEFIRIIERYLTIQVPLLENITFKNGKASHSISLSEVIYFTSERRLVCIICMDREYSFYDKLDHVQEMMEKKRHRFLRIHQSYLVNMRYISQYHYNSVVMNNGISLPISAEYRKPVNQVHKILLELDDNMKSKIPQS